MICLACNALRTPRGGEGNASSRVSAGVARRAVGAIVAVIILGASCTNLDADVCVAAWSGGIAVVVELTLIFAQYRIDGTFATILANDAVYARRSTVGVGIRLASGTLHTLTQDISCRSLPVVATQARCARCCSVVVTVDLTSNTLSTLCFAATSVCACPALNALGDWIGVVISSAR